jgi:SAM-dependent methyltransferase
MGFSAEWLALREPADRAARDGALARLACAELPAAPVVLDLGAGTGATRRALGGLLPEATEWILVDNDPALLAMAGEGAGRVRTVTADLGDLAALPFADASLVTASALLDLVSGDWLAALVECLRARGLPFYATLSYDGTTIWDPPAAGDNAVLRAFNRDQRRDKGFGPALGPEAAETAARLFAGAGFRVRVAPSPWRLDASDSDLQKELLHGIAAAAGDAANWLEERLSLLPGATCRVGHVDFLALPPAKSDTAAPRAIIDQGRQARSRGAEDA